MRKLILLSASFCILACMGVQAQSCDLAIGVITISDESCPDANDGTITIAASTSNGPITYSISGPVNLSNGTGLFTDLPDGSYSILVRDGSFPAGDCDRTASAIVNAGVDLIKPTASDPEPLNVTCIADIPPADPAVVTDEYDNCSIPTVSLFSQNSSGIGNQSSPRVVTRTYRVTDAAGNFIDVIHTINVIDNVAPSITCPSNITTTTATGQCSAMVSFSTPIASDNCGPVTVSLISNLGSGSSFPVGISTVIFEAEDAVGNTRVCSFTIRVKDQENPSLVCPSNIVKTNDPGECGAIVTYTPPVGADNCSVISTDRIGGLGSGASFPIGVTTERYEATDASGNTKDCSFTVTVKDMELPTLGCVNSHQVSLEADGTFDLLKGASVQGPYLQMLLFTKFEDNCDVDRFFIDYNPHNLQFDCGDLGDNFVQFSARDVNGNTSYCTVNIIVTDAGSACNQAPVAKCKDIEVNADANCEAMITAVQIDDGSFDPDGDALNFSLNDYGPFGKGPHTVELTVSDGQKTDKCTTKVTVLDVTAPEKPAAPAPVSGSCAADVPVEITLTAVDACDGDITVSPTTVKINGSCPNRFVMTRTWTFTDLSGNSTSVSQTITISDEIGPTLSTPPNVTIECDESTLPAHTGTATATDNCDGIVTPGYSDSFTGILGDNCYTILRTWTATDACGNSNSKLQRIVVQDTKKPLLTIPSDKTIECDESTAPAHTGTATATDNCSPVNKIVIISTDKKVDILGTDCYTIERTWTATDQCGNSDIRVQKIKVQDTKPPVFTFCPANTEVNCDQSIPAVGTPTAMDNCDESVSISYLGEVRDNSCGSDYYTLTRSWEAEDNCGNTRLCEQVITVNTRLYDHCFSIALDISYDVSSNTTTFNWDLCVEDAQCQDLSNVRFSLPCDLNSRNGIVNSGSTASGTVIDISGKPSQCNKYAIVFENFGDKGIKDEPGGCATFYYTLAGDYRDYKTDVAVKAGRESGLGFSAVGANCDCDGSVPAVYALPGRPISNVLQQENPDLSVTQVKVLAYPNPARSDVTIEFRMEEKSKTIIDLFDMQGRWITRLFDQDTEADEEYTIKIDRSKYAISQGSYFYRLQSASQTLQGKILFMD